MKHKLIAVAALVTLIVVAAGCAGESGGGSAKRVAIAVTKKGFEPDRVNGQFTVTRIEKATQAK